MKKARCYTTARQRESSEAPENLYDKVEENDLTYRPKAGCGCVRAAAAAFGKGLGVKRGSQKTMKRKHYIAGLAALTLIGTMTVCPAVSASTEHYNDSSKTGTEEAWSAWQGEWESVASDFTKVSITPGADETQLNFAWYSEKKNGEATPIVHFGTDADKLEAFTGESE